MKITEIIEILRKDNTSYLWDLPKPKWEAIDYYNLNQIKQGNDYKNKKKVLDFVELSDKSLKMQQEQQHRMKPIRRKSDGKVFSGMIQLCRETGINRSSLSLALNNRPNGLQKYKDEYEFISNQNN
jgi:hypothetical protein